MRAHLPINAGADILTDPKQADALRRQIEPLLTDDDANVVLDFGGINGVSPEFLDALLGPLHDRFGVHLSDRLHLDGCSAALLADLRAVAERGSMTEIAAVPRRQSRSAAA